jgi:ribose transport system ATP-binding protein
MEVVGMIEPQSQQLPAAPVLCIEHLSKSFAGKAVLSDVTFTVGSGEVVGLVGQNGSGKSTLIKVVSGFYEPDDGATIRVNDRELSHVNSRARDAMAFVHQNLGLFDTLPVVDNLMVNRWARNGGQIHWRTVKAEAQALLDEFDLDIDPGALVGSLSSGDRAVIAIARAVGDLAQVDQGLLVLDEPTPYLARDEVGRLFAAIRAAASRGIGVLFVSHRLDEVEDVTDRVVVLRDGRKVGDRKTSDLAEGELVQLIVGRPISDFYPSVSESATEIALKVVDLSIADMQPVSFDLSRGEILGLTGLLGSGFERIPYALGGAANVKGGTAQIDDELILLARNNPGTAIEAGMVLVPADRPRLGVALGMSVRENMSLPWIDRLSTRLGINRGLEQREAENLVTRFDVRPADPGALMGTLSGGNQQKTVLARWIAQGPKVLLLHEPTQGVDVGARQQIFQVIRDASIAGMSVIYASLEYEDVAHMCDKVLVFRDGSVVAELVGADITTDRIVDISMRKGSR